MNITVNTATLVAAGAGIAGVGLGWKGASKLVHDTFSQDIFGDPRRPIEANGSTTIIQVREPQGGSITTKMVIGGAIATFVGGVLALGGPGLAATGAKQIGRLGAGVALFGLGAGAIAGAGYINEQYTGGDFLPAR